MFCFVLLHKGCFYFTLGNLHPKHRSALNSIQLLALVKVDLLSIYGMDKVLEPIVEDLQKLEKVKLQGYVDKSKFVYLSVDGGT